MEKVFYVYMLANKYNTVIYIGVTCDLRRRVEEHKRKIYSGFTSKYNVDKLVYYESFNYIEDAIMREKQLKAGSRLKKIRLIEKTNMTWRELSPPIN